MSILVVIVVLEGLDKRGLFFRAEVFLLFESEFVGGAFHVRVLNKI